MQRHKHQTKIHTIDELNQRLIEVWCGFEQSTVDMAVSVDSGVEDLELVCVRKEDTSNITFELTDRVDFVNSLSPYVVFCLNVAPLSKTMLL